MDLVSAIVPGGEEATFSLGSFIQLVRREWSDPVGKHFLPEKRYSVLQVAKAVAAWATLQGLTHRWQEKRWSLHLRKIHLHESSSKATPPQPPTCGTPALRVTADVIFPGSKGQIISADIGEAVDDASRDPCPNHQAPDLELYLLFRRLSKLVLAGYGGASLLFFGLSPDAFVSPGVLAGGEANQVAEAVEASERPLPPGPSPPTHYSWWDLLLGRHDQDIFHNHARSSTDTQFDAIKGVEPRMPRYWVLSDHGRKQVVLVIRGAGNAIVTKLKVMTRNLAHRHSVSERFGCRPYLRTPGNRP